MEPEYVKWIAALALLILTLFFCSLPLYLRRRIGDGVNQPNYDLIISLISCAGGGVFLATCLLHLFPEVQEQMSKVFHMLGMKQKFPISEFLMAFGFLLVLVIEQIVLMLQQQNEQTVPLLAHQHSHGDHASPSSGHHTQYGTVPSYSEHSLHEDPSSHSPLRSAVLVLALSLHSIFEGFAIGLQSSGENVLRILAAVLIHKSIIAFTLGLNLVNSKLKRSSVWQCVAIFSSMSPIGTVIGSLISNIGSGITMAVTSGILQGIAAGTFIYVTFFEVLPHELNSSEYKMPKVLCLILGFSAMSLLVLFVPA